MCARNVLLTNSPIKGAKTPPIRAQIDPVDNPLDLRTVGVSSAEKIYATSKAMPINIRPVRDSAGTIQLSVTNLFFHYVFYVTFFIFVNRIYV